MNRSVKVMKGILFASGLLAVIVLLSNCNNNTGVRVKSAPVQKHQVQIESEGAAMLYVDRIPCSAVMKSADSTGGLDGFQCYLVGFVDSLPETPSADKKDTETGKYYQYDMQHDWVMLNNGDSLRPVFFQPKQKFEKHLNEGILVFETMAHKEQDTLVYKDRYGSWGIQKIIITSNKK